MEVDTCGPMDDFEDLLHLICMLGSNVHKIAMHERLARVLSVELEYRAHTTYLLTKYRPEAIIHDEVTIVGTN